MENQRHTETYRNLDIEYNKKRKKRADREIKDTDSVKKYLLSLSFHLHASQDVASLRLFPILIIGFLNFTSELWNPCMDILYDPLINK